MRQPDIIPDKAADEVDEQNKQNQLRRDMVSGESRQSIKSAIQNIDDADAQQALASMYEVLTGEEIQL